MSAFYETKSGDLWATPYTRGPWDANAQHGGPPAALLGGMMERFGPTAKEMLIARVWTEVLRPVPIGKMEAHVEMVRQGKRCLLYTSPSPRDATLPRMPSSA